MGRGLIRTSIPKVASILIHPTVWPQLDMGRKEGAAVPLTGSCIGPHLRQCGLAEAYLDHICCGQTTGSIKMIDPVVWPQQIWAEN